MSSHHSEEPRTELTALYTGPSSTNDFTHSLPSSSPQSTEEKTNYLSALRKSVVQLQAEVNELLTTKMDEDKAAQGAMAHHVDESREEENYGEEVTEEG